MQMLNKKEFVTELLNKYEITHGLSNDIINGMIDRGFIPSVTNEVGDKTYNLDYYTENEDMFESRLREYKNTRSYYSDTELKEALVSRDSSFSAVPVNSFNNLARRNLINKDYVYVVRSNEVFLFAPNVIYNLDEMKSALTELDAQLEAEEAEEIALLTTDEIEETEVEETNEDLFKGDDEETFEEDFFDDYDDKRAAKKARDKAIAKERLRKEEAIRAAELAEKERAAAAAATAKAMVSDETIAFESNSDSYLSTEYTQKTSEYSTDNSDYSPKYDKPDSLNRKEPELSKADSQYTSEGYSSPVNEYKEDEAHKFTYEDHKNYKDDKSVISDNKEYSDNKVYSDGNGYSDNKGYNTEHQEYQQDKKPESFDTKITSENRFDSSIEKSNETKYAHDNYLDSNKHKEEVLEEKAAKKQYEAERRETFNEEKKEKKPDMRSEDGSFTFTGTQVGKSDSNSESTYSKSESSSEGSFQNEKRYQPYKIQVPLANGSYMTFEATGAKESNNNTSKVHSEDPYDNYNVRAQTVYATSGAVMSQQGVNELIAAVNKNSEEGSFKVSVSTPDENGNFKSKTIYQSGDANTFIGDIAEAYKNGSMVDRLPEQTAEQSAVNQKVLSAVGVESGGEISGDVYIPPAVPAIHPRVFDELSEQGIKYVEVNGSKVDISTMTEVTKNNFSVINDATEYQNSVIAKKQIEEYSKNLSDVSQKKADAIKKSEQIIAAAAKSKNDYNDRFSIDKIKSNPEFVPAYLREKYVPEQKKNIVPDNGTVNYAQGFGSSKPLGTAGDFNQYAGRTATRTRVLEKHAQESTSLGSASQAVDTNYVHLDYSKPEQIEAYAKKIERAQPELAKELRNLSRQINGDVAVVMAAQSAGTVPAVDGFRMLTSPETYIQGKAEYAEIVAAAIENTNPDAAQRIRDLSKKLNGDTTKNTEGTSNITFDVNSINDEFINNAKNFKGNAAEIERVAASLDYNNPEMAKKLREASKAINGDAAVLYSRTTIAERNLNRVLPNQADNAASAFGVKTVSNENIKTAKFVMGGQEDVFNVNKNIKGRITADNLRTTQKMLTFVEKDRLGRKHLNIATFNSNGTINITWDADKKKDSVTLLGYAPDVNQFDDSELQGTMASKSKLLKNGIRNRKLEEFRFVSSNNSQFALDPEWVKSRRKIKSPKQGEAEENDAVAQDLWASAKRVYDAYQAGITTTNIDVIVDKNGMAGDGSIVKGLRAQELRKETLKENLSGTAKNIFRRVMPTSEFNGTYLGTGIKYMLGRGSVIWVASQYGSSILAKEMRADMASEVYKKVGPQNFKAGPGAKKLDFNSAKDRRAIAKELSKLSQAKFKTDITRLSATSLQKALTTGVFGGKKLDSQELELFEAALKLKGMNEGTLRLISPYAFMKANGIQPFNPALNTKFKDLLGGKKIENLSLGEINLIFKEHPNLDAELAQALQIAQGMFKVERNRFGKIKKIHAPSMENEESLKTILKVLSNKSLDARFSEFLKGVSIGELSDNQIQELLKKLATNNNKAANELKALLNQTADLREKSEKLKDIKDKAGGKTYIAQFMAQKGLMKIRHTYLGAGIYTTWNLYRTIKTVKDVSRTIRVINGVMRDVLIDWLKSGKAGSLRNKILNSKLADIRRKSLAKKSKKIAKKAEKAAQKQANRLAKKASKKVARQNKRAARKGASKAGKKIRKVTGKIRRPASRLRGATKGLRNAVGRLAGRITSPFKAVAKLLAKAKASIINFLKPILGKIAIAFLVIVFGIIGIQFAFGMLSAGLEAVYSTIYYTNNEKLDEDTGLNIEETLVDNSVELCINLDSALKYYNEKFFDNKTVIDSVKKAIEDEGFKDELDSFYDPATGKSANIKRLGTTLRGIQTGIYYSYYNGDGQEIGYKSNAKDITSMANAWIGEDYRTKGLYKSYVEKLWNYTHIVAYAPRTQGENTVSEASDGHKYNGNKYIYICPSNNEDSDCYENKYDYKCNNASANVYKDQIVRTDIKNGVDKEFNKVNDVYHKKTETENTYVSIKNGIVEYNKKGCRQHIRYFHNSGTGDKQSGVSTGAMLGSTVPNCNNCGSFTDNGRTYYYCKGHCPCEGAVDNNGNKINCNGGTESASIKYTKYCTKPGETMSSPCSNCVSSTIKKDCNHILYPVLHDRPDNCKSGSWVNDYDENGNRIGRHWECKICKFCTNEDCSKKNEIVSGGVICTGKTTQTIYTCKGHTVTKNITVQAPCKGYCPGHTVEHYCTGHIDLNVANVTLFLEDKNSMLYLGIPKQVSSEKKEVYAREELSLKGERKELLEVQTPVSGTEYLYDNVFNNEKFKKFNYAKYPLPSMGMFDDLVLDLKGKSVSDPGNYGNPLDTLRWNETFITDEVEEKTINGVKTKSLNDVISRLFSSFSEKDMWEDRNDGATGNWKDFAQNVDAFNIKGSYSKFGKHHYFTGFFKYDENGKLEMAGSEGNKTPRDNGPASRATEATKEDWYIAYKIVFPGAYNAAPNDKEVERIMKNIISVAAGTSYQAKVTNCMSASPGIKDLLKDIGNKYTGGTEDFVSDKSGLSFACNWYRNFYQAQSSSGPTLTKVIDAYNQTKSFENYSYKCRKFRQILEVNALSGTKDSPKSQEEIENVIKNLSIGDLIGAGDEVYIVLYNDTNTRTYPNGTDPELRGIDKGHVIVATVNGSGQEDSDQIHLFSFTSEYISKKPDLFWVYKCTPGYTPN